jgi:hypothetical protein
MIEAFVKYFVLGMALGMADRSSSRWFRLGRTRREAAATLRAMRYLLERYQPASFEEDCKQREFRTALLEARQYYQRGQVQAARRLDELLAKVDGAPPARANSTARARAWMQKEKIAPLSFRSKAVVATALCLLLDVVVLLGSGLGAGAIAMLWSVLEVPALLGGLLAAPWASRALSAALGAFGRDSDVDGQLQATAQEIERQKRSLHLRLSSAASLLPGEEPVRLPPSG